MSALVALVIATTMHAVAMIAVAYVCYRTGREEGRREGVLDTMEAWRESTDRRYPPDVAGRR